MNKARYQRCLCAPASVLLLFTLFLPGCDGRRPIPDGALVIRNGTVIDGTGVQPIQNGVVVVEGDRIIAVGVEADFRVGPEATIVDAGGGTIMPGFINSHVHHGAPANTRHLFLPVGVTSVCDLGSDTSEMDEFLERMGSDGPAARGFRGGPIVTAPGGYPDAAYRTHINYEVATPEEGRAGVRDLSERGADLIKIALDPGWDFENPRPVPDLETTRAVVEEAHARGLLVRAHLIQPPQMDLAIEAGVDVVEHLAMPRWPSREEEDRVIASDDPVGLFFDRWAPDYQPRLEKMAAQGTAMVPTVSALLHDFYVAEDPTPRQAWVVDVVLDIVRRFHEAGGMVGVANDFNDRGAKERLPLLELEMLQEAGLSTMEVIVAATLNNAVVCGQDENLGTLEPGKLADIIVVDGDPLVDLVGSIQNVTHVVLGGEVVIGAGRPGNGSGVSGAGLPSELPTELQEAIHTFYHSIETDDHETRIALFSDDALMLPNHGERIVGKEAIAEVIRGGAGWLFRLRDRIVLDAQADGEIAYTVNAYDYTYHPAGEEPTWHPTKNVHIWKRDAHGQWKLHVDLWNADDP